MWIILIGIAGVILLTWLFTSLRGGSSSESLTTTSPEPECCGAHEICDKETLLSTSGEIVYYEDEELDQFSNSSTEEYTSGDIEQFREVLYTMRDDEVAGWLRSLQLRNIQPPAVIREEALMIVADVRDLFRKNSKTTST